MSRVCGSSATPGGAGLGGLAGVPQVLATTEHLSAKPPGGRTTWRTSPGGRSCRTRSIRAAILQIAWHGFFHWRRPRRTVHWQGVRLPTPVGASGHAHPPRPPASLLRRPVAPLVPADRRPRPRRPDAAAPPPRRGAVRHTVAPASVIMVYLSGGLAHQDTFDLKPNAPAEVRGEFKPIATNVPGIQIGELLPRLARCMDKLAAAPLARRPAGRAQQLPEHDRLRHERRRSARASRTSAR